VRPEPSTAAAAPSGEPGAPAPRRAGRGMARNTAIFSVLTGFSRIAGLVREIVASSYFATSGAFSAFTIAFQVPNVVRSLFADAALSAAFVPVFTELLEHKRRPEAFRLASTLVLLIVGVLGAITVLFVAAAGIVVPLFVGDRLAPVEDLTVGLSRVLFPVVLILGLNGLLVGILNAYDHFSIPALSPLVWNAVIIAFLVASHQLLDGTDELYGYAVGVLAGTAVQLAMAAPVLRRLGFRFTFAGALGELGDRRVRRVLALMLPVTLGLGLINLNLLVNSVLGGLVSEAAPRAIDAAFRIYMLPQGIFSVAIATVLFPALSRLAARRDFDALRGLVGNGMRQVLLLLVPAAAATLALATPITRLIYEHGAFGPDSTELVAEALLWFSFSLPTSGVNLLLTRTFFSLQRPWITTAIAALNLAVNAAVSIALYEPFGIAGIVVGTAAGSLAMTLGQAHFLRRELAGRLEARETLVALAGMLVAAAALAGVAYAVWWGFDELLGRGLAAQVVSVCGGLAAGGAAYVGLVLAMRIPEAQQILRLVAGRLRRHDERRP
jgi:putative peptidoglycan lipid II flippase